jgi:hypothetical protein
VEIDARNLDKKYTILSELFKTRFYFSALLREFDARRPVGVTVSQYDVRSNTINVSGYATSYISVADFINSLLGDGMSIVADAQDLSELFTAVKLNSVTLDSGNKEVKYSLKIEYDATKLVEY